MPLWQLWMKQPAVSLRFVRCQLYLPALGLLLYFNTASMDAHDSDLKPPISLGKRKVPDGRPDSTRQFHNPTGQWEDRLAIEGREREPEPESQSIEDERSDLPSIPLTDRPRVLPPHLRKRLRPVTTETNNAVGSTSGSAVHVSQEITSTIPPRNEVQDSQTALASEDEQMLVAPTSSPAIATTVPGAPTQITTQSSRSLIITDATASLQDPAAVPAERASLIDVTPTVSNVGAVSKPTLPEDDVDVTSMTGPTAEPTTGVAPDSALIPIFATTGTASHTDTASEAGPLATDAATGQASEEVVATSTAVSASTEEPVAEISGLALSPVLIPTTATSDALAAMEPVSSICDVDATTTTSQEEETGQALSISTAEPDTTTAPCPAPAPILTIETQTAPYTTAGSAEAGSMTADATTEDALQEVVAMQPAASDLTAPTTLLGSTLSPVVTSPTTEDAAAVQGAVPGTPPAKPTPASGSTANAVEIRCQDSNAARTNETEQLPALGECADPTQVGHFGQRSSPVNGGAWPPEQASSLSSSDDTPPYPSESSIRNPRPNFPQPSSQMASYQPFSSTSVAGMLQDSRSGSCATPLVSTTLGFSRAHAQRLGTLIEQRNPESLTSSSTASTVVHDMVATSPAQHVVSGLMPISTPLVPSTSPIPFGSLHATSSAVAYNTVDAVGPAEVMDVDLGQEHSGFEVKAFNPHLKNGGATKSDTFGARLASHNEDVEMSPSSEMTRPDHGGATHGANTGSSQAQHIHTGLDPSFQPVLYGQPRQSELRPLSIFNILRPQGHSMSVAASLPSWPASSTFAAGARLGVASSIPAVVRETAKGKERAADMGSGQQPCHDGRRAHPSQPTPPTHIGPPLQSRIPKDTPPSPANSGHPMLDVVPDVPRPGPSTSSMSTGLPSHPEGRASDANGRSMNDDSPTGGGEKPDNDVPLLLADLLRIVQSNQKSLKRTLDERDTALLERLDARRQPEPTSDAPRKRQKRTRTGRDGRVVPPPTMKVDPEVADHPLYSHFLTCVRAEFKELLGVDNLKSLDPQALCCRSLTQQELDDFCGRLPGRIEVTPEAFRFDFRLTRSHPFNMHALNVFVDSFQNRVAAGWYRNPAPLPELFLHRKHILTAIYNHCRSAKSIFFRTFVNPETPEDVDDRLAAASRSSRKYRLFRKRVDAVRRKAAQHLALMNTAGAQSVSSDESSDELVHDATGQLQDKTERISPEWRSPEFQAFHHSLDPIVTDLSRPRVGTRQKPGANPRYRALSNRVNRAAVAPSGLPRICYNPTWLQTLDSHEIAELQISEEDYDLSPVSYEPKQPWYRRARRVPLSQRRRGIHAETRVGE
ncbi:unnamed protein product [Peniophora sp. CBMAI 1063]|nr:unnamed protein product [Peniophora sp. CBMAI 1063]